MNIDCIRIRFVPYYRLYNQILIHTLCLYQSFNPRYVFLQKERIYMQS